MKLPIGLFACALLAGWSLCIASPVAASAGTPFASDRLPSIDKCAEANTQSCASASYLLQRGVPPLLKHAEIPYPDKENTGLPQTKALEDWQGRPEETKPLLKPGRTDSASDFWKPSPSSSSASSSAGPRKKGAVGRATNAIAHGANTVGRFFKKHHRRRSLQPDSWEGGVTRRPLISLLKKRGQGSSQPQAGGQTSGQPKKIGRESQSSSWPTLFSIGTPPSPNRSSWSSGRRSSKSYSPERPGMASLLAKSPKSPRNKPKTPNNSPKSPSPPTRPATQSRSPSPHLPPSGPSPSSSQAVWRPKPIRNPAEVHKGQPAYENWGRFYEPKLKSPQGGSDVKITPKPVRTEPGSKKPGGLSRMFG